MSSSDASSAADSASLEALPIPAEVYVLPLKRKVPTSSLDNTQVVKIPGTNRRRMAATYTEVLADGSTKVHNVSVYIKSAEPAEGEAVSAAPAAPKKRKQKEPKEKVKKLSDIDHLHEAVSSMHAILEGIKAKKSRRAAKKQKSDAPAPAADSSVAAPAVASDSAAAAAQ